MSRADERRVAEALGKALGLEFAGASYPLKTWGTVDDWVQISKDTALLLEVETSQKHPSTNVLKLWPYLEERPELTVILVQVFFSHSPGLASNRGRIGEWLGAKMESLLGGRFVYHRLVGDAGLEAFTGLDGLKATLKGLDPVR